MKSQPLWGPVLCDDSDIQSLVFLRKLSNVVPWSRSFNQLRQLSVGVTSTPQHLYLPSSRVLRVLSCSGNKLITVNLGGDIGPAWRQGALEVGAMSEMDNCSEKFLLDPGQTTEKSPPGAGKEATAWRQPDQGSSNSDEEGSSTWEEPEVTQPCLQDKLHVKVAALVVFLLLKYCNKQPTRQAEMLEIVSKDYQDDFPVIMGQASECLRLVFGMDIKEVDPSDHSYVLVTVLGLTCDGMLSSEQGMPKTSLLVLLLGVILLEDDCASQGEVWEVLGAMGVYAGKEHIICGEPRELLTKVWVQEGYLEYQRVPGSDPARYEFLWGPRAHAETSEMQVLEYLLWVNRRQPSSSLILSEGAVSDEGEGA
ncbi:PREDICTED: melanoma-associated antigen 4-like [Odobenus rosmarus divergens]|uniref:Melanoma-associated antigen 4-like n=1 Tax=Odobenus rosmarus divergens TaxID=9708 RepID=A0A9B0LZ03_ODORO